jgi:dTDP-4-dehydrorhamnose 3,5-epimerase-like enzyme
MLRGMHFQNPGRQGKPVQVLDGGIVDTAGRVSAESLEFKLAKSLQFGLLSTSLIR